MRCKQGDLCVILPAKSASGRHAIVAGLIVGQFVTVTRLRPPDLESCYSRLIWEFKHPIVVELADGARFEVRGAGDEVLQPIRGQRPGEARTIDAGAGHEVLTASHV